MTFKDETREEKLQYGIKIAASSCGRIYEY